ncbi:YhjD/YihY/BrkB family envelope integrity protein [Natronoarchaeum sp. GCM10025703]|uniref:YhjD/YihY/BrkB family envelope integrity protein n=1 Tax=Natronoarchaeum sp. GCM10025703 TaxID=3252685 RepID=UPI0036228916
MGDPSMSSVDQLRTILRTAQSEGITFLAAGVAYYAFVSLIPLMLLALVIGSIMGGDVFEGQIIAFVGEFLTPEAQEALVEALTGEAGRSGATAIGQPCCSGAHYGSFGDSIGRSHRCTAPPERRRSSIA